MGSPTMPGGPGSTPSVRQESLAGCFVRLTWALAAPAAAAVSFALVLLGGRAELGTADAAGGAAVVAGILTRFLDDPRMTPSRRAYAILAVGLGLALWGVARGIRFLAG